MTAAAVVSLSLAIGACTAAFSLVDALILRPLPVNDPERLVYVAQRVPGDTRDGLSFNYPLFETLRDAGRTQVRLFGLSDQSRQDAIFDDATGQPEKVYGQGISGDSFELLGVKPALGRLLSKSDDVTPGQHPVAVLSYDFWSRRFNRDPHVLGRWVTIREKQLQIVGIAEKRFTGAEPGIMTDIWAPMMMWDEQAIRDSATRWFRIWGRLQPGVAPEHVRPVLQTIFTNFQREQAAASFAGASRDRIERFVNTAIFLRSAANGPSRLREDFELALLILAGAALLVLLIACANVAGLLVARAAGRDREMALRVSIGAGRGRLIQQVLIESALLSIASCAVGALIAAFAAPAVVDLLSTSRSVVRLDLNLDWRVLCFLAGAGSIVTCLFGLIPALRASAVSPNEALKAGSGKHTAKIGIFRPLLGAQTAFSFVVLFVGGMCLASFSRLLQTDAGFDKEEVVLVSIEARDLQPLAVWAQLVERLKETPGIQSASLSGWGLFEGSGRNKEVRIPGKPMDGYSPWFLPVAPRFFETMGIRLLDGRDFEWRDAEPELPSVVVVNESFARRYFPGESALGRRFLRIDAGRTLVPQDIIGIVADAKYTNIREAAPPTVYDPLRPDVSATVEVRTQLERESLAPLVRDAISRAHPAFQMTDITRQSTLVDNHLVRDRALALLSAFFSIVAIVLAGVGLYGVLSYSVVQRTREIGIRVALGARPVAVAGLLVTEIGLVMAIGLAVGAIGGAAASRFITALLYQVKGTDAISIAAPLICLFLVCTAAAVLPVLRAARVDPTTALRYE